MKREARPYWMSMQASKYPNSTPEGSPISLLALAEKRHGVTSGGTMCDALSCLGNAWIVKAGATVFHAAARPFWKPERKMVLDPILHDIMAANVPAVRFCVWS